MLYKNFQTPRRVIVTKSFTVQVALDLDNFVKLKRKVGDEMMVIASYINQENELTYIALDEEVIDSYPVSNEYIKEKEEVLTSTTYD